MIAYMFRFLAIPVSILFWLTERVCPFAFAIVPQKSRFVYQRSSAIIGIARVASPLKFDLLATRNRVELIYFEEEKKWRRIQATLPSHH